MSKNKRERIALSVSKGCLIPADSYASSKLRERGYKIGDLLLADLAKPRNPAFNRLVHRIGQLVVANIEAFAGMEAHRAIKRLQLEGRIACEEVGYNFPGVGFIVQFIPRSLSFEMMEEGEYQEVAKAICRLIAERYWRDLTPEQIEEMAESFIGE